MLHRIHQKLGTAGFVISIVALVAALSGGAYAASGGLTGKQKKEVEKIAKKYAGKPGAPGATGPAGAAGSKGDPGAAGSNGTNGAPGENGKSVVASPASSTECAGGIGGTKFEVEGSGAASHVCNGKNGTTGFTEFLPSGKTETGVFATNVGSVRIHDALVPLSFPIPLEAPLPQGHAKFVQLGETEVEGCPGTEPLPAADPGFLCVYVKETNVTPRLFGGVSSVEQAGAIVSLFLTVEGAPAEAEFAASGTWAVTAE